MYSRVHVSPRILSGRRSKPRNTKTKLHRWPLLRVWSDPPLCRLPALEHGMDGSWFIWTGGRDYTLIFFELVVFFFYNVIVRRLLNFRFFSVPPLQRKFCSREDSRERWGRFFFSVWDFSLLLLLLWRVAAAMLRFFIFTFSWKSSKTVNIASFLYNYQLTCAGFLYTSSFHIVIDLFAFFSMKLFQIIVCTTIYFFSEK